MLPCASDLTPVRYQGVPHRDPVVSEEASPPSCQWVVAKSLGRGLLPGKAALLGLRVWEEASDLLRMRPGVHNR